jgi:hypothetical protein
MLPVFRAPGWKAGTSQIDRVIHRLLITIGTTLVGLRFAHISSYIEKWKAHAKLSSDEVKRP